MKRILAVSAFLLLGVLLPSRPAQQSDLPQAKGQASLQHEVSVVGRRY